MNIRRTTPLKRRSAFRLWATSYVIQADLLSNVRFLSGKIDDIELVPFKSEEIEIHEERLPFLIGGHFGEQEELTPKGFS